MTHPLPEEGAGHALVDDDPVVFQVECDTPLLEGVGSEDDLVRKREVKPKAPRGVPWLKELVSSFPEGESNRAKPCEWAWMRWLPMPALPSML
jgi:hypothetical protein